MSEKLRDGGGLPCPDCGSPLVPCRCERERDGGRKVRRPGSTLRADPRKRMKARTLEEKFGDDPLRYGTLFREIRLLPCFGSTYLPGHVCGLGYAPATAHHLGKTDLDGLLPVCGHMHDQVGEQTLEVEKRLREAGRPSLSGLGRLYLVRTIGRLSQECGRLAPEIAMEARKRGFSW